MDFEAALPAGSWFRDYLTLWPTTEPPRSYILFAGMSMLGAALGRQVHMKVDVHTVWPMMNLLLIGPSGIGKSTSLVDIALHHLISGPEAPLELVDRPQVISGKATKEKLHEDLVINSHAIVMASELANFFSKEKYMEGMIPYVTELLDCKPTSVRTKSGNLQTVQEPTVTVVGGSTVEWLQGQLPDSAAAGGFLARFLIVKEDHKFQRVADPETMLSKTQWAALHARRAEVLQEFKAICRLHTGRIGFANYSASDAYTLWYNTHQPETGHLSPFSARAGEFVRRLSMLLALSCKRTSVTAEDVNSAIQLYRYAIAKLQEVVVPLTPQGKLIASVLQCVSNQPMSDVQLKRAMRNSATSKMVDEILASLLASKDLVRLPDGRFQKSTK